MRLFFYGVLFTLILALAGITALVTSGAIPVAAAKKEPSLVAWFLHTVFERRVVSEAQSISSPEDLETLERAQEGARSFASMCAGCHTPPGKDPSVVSRGLNPSPPQLVDIRGHHRAAELFWVISNGVRMTGMPAFGPSHSEEQIWALVSFLQFAESLDDLSYSEYLHQARAAVDPNAEGDGHDHRHFDEDQVPVGDEAGSPASAEEPPDEESLDPESLDEKPGDEIAPVENPQPHRHGEHDHGDHQH